MNKTQIEQPTINLEVLRDGQPDYDYMPEPPTVLETVATKASAILGDITDKVGLEVSSVAYDVIHRTHYNRMRRQLLRDERNYRHAEKIGLISLAMRRDK